MVSWYIWFNPEDKNTVNHKGQSVDGVASWISAAVAYLRLCACIDLDSLMDTVCIVTTIGRDRRYV